MKGERIVIPENMRQYILCKLHEAHQGIIKCQLGAKSCFFWNGINHDIETLNHDIKG